MTLCSHMNTVGYKSCIRRPVLSILFEPWGSGMGVLLVYRYFGFISIVV